MRGELRRHLQNAIWRMLIPPLPLGKPPSYPAPLCAELVLLGGLPLVIAPSTYLQEGLNLLQAPPPGSARVGVGFFLGDIAPLDKVKDWGGPLYIKCNIR